MLLLSYFVDKSGIKSDASILNSSPKISIITCCWNSEPYLQECLQSLQSQDYPNIEFVFVDGGSTDGTLERIQAMPGDVKCLTGIRGGISHAMNVGVEFATGEYIAHLHSDDYYLNPNVVSKALDGILTAKAEWAFGRIVSDIEGKRIPNSWAMPKYSARRLLKGNFIMHPALFMTKQLFTRAGGFSTELKYAMDYDLWLRLAKLAKPVYLDFEIAAFRRHAGSTSTANGLNAFVEDYMVRKKYIGFNPVARIYHEAVYRWRRRRFGGV